MAPCQSSRNQVYFILIVLGSLTLSDLEEDAGRMALLLAAIAGSLVHWLAELTASTGVSELVLVAGDGRGRMEGREIGEFLGWEGGGTREGEGRLGGTPMQPNPILSLSLSSILKLLGPAPAK